MIRAPDVVVTDVTNPVATSAADAFIVGIALASGVLRQVAPLNILMREGADDNFGVIRAAIAYDDQFEIAQRLTEHGLDARLDVPAAPERRHHD